MVVSEWTLVQFVCYILCEVLKPREAEEVA